MIPAALALADLVDPAITVALAELENEWPVGAAVRHRDNTWTGVVHLGDPKGTRLDTPGVLHTGAHTLLWLDANAATAVCVRYLLDGVPVVAWYRPAALRKVQVRA